MIEAPHYAADGAKRGANFALPQEYFDGTVNEPVLHQAVKVYLNNQRQGTHMTKSRSFVSGGNQKPWKQKGTGRARQGSIRAPHWRGGVRSTPGPARAPCTWWSVWLSGLPRRRSSLISWPAWVWLDERRWS